MMNAHELRVGNFVLNSDNEIDKILSICSASNYDENLKVIEFAEVCLDKKGHGETDIKPIAISSKLLVDKYTLSKKYESELKKGDELHFAIGGNTIIFEYESEEEGIYYTGGTGVKLSINVKYVHQLQNLIYELYGVNINLV